MAALTWAAIFIGPAQLAAGSPKKNGLYVHIDMDVSLDHQS
jgi:hypothetical protein